MPSPYPLIEYLPAVFAEDRFLVRWTAAMDDVLAPIVNIIDCLPAYVDPRLAPEDFAGWPAGSGSCWTRAGRCRPSGR
jgi:phage tail-like protein